MRPELFLRAKAIFQEALEREPDAREAFLDEACGADVELRREVDSLLDLEGQPPLRRMIEDAMPTRPAPQAAAPPVTSAESALTKSSARSDAGEWGRSIWLFAWTRSTARRSRSSSSVPG